MRQFQCSKCDKIFKAKGEKIEGDNPIYGKVWQWQSKHECGQVCEEYIAPKAKKKRRPKPPPPPKCTGYCPTCPFQH